jgi:nitroimidazol reductase NimA-like FMN-containing flavoprotein (pyridoxamine 5'-phosphate oxidase superfamily)
MREANQGRAVSLDEIKEFLEKESIGTLSVSSGDESAPYTIPMTFAYNRVEPIVFQFIVHHESEKMKHIQDGCKATLSVMDKQEGGWISCMIMGELSPVDEQDQETAEAIFEKHIPDLDIDLFTDRDDYDIEYWHLTFEEAHGRRSGSHPYPPR